MKKAIYINVDEDIASIVNRVQRLKQKILYIMIPKKAIFFQSSVNLKVLKNTFDRLDKKLILVTMDPVGRRLAEKLKIKTMQRIEIQKRRPDEEDDPDIRIQPIQARRNEVRREGPKRFTEKKITIAEFIREFRLSDKIRRKNNTHSSFHFTSSNHRFLSLILIISVGLFGLITYIALPGATLYIQPAFDDINHTMNITLADKRRNHDLLSQNEFHIIASEEVVTVTKQTKIFNTTSQEFRGKNAVGKITVINTSDEEWEFREGTRFQTEEDLIFIALSPLNVPPAHRNEAGNLIPGRLVTRVEATPFDLYDAPIGDRGNISATRFILPGLSKYNQRLVWGESFEPMTGGVTDYLKVVTSEDIESAKKQIKDNLILTAKEELLAHLESKNRLNHTHLVLLDDGRHLTTELLDLRLSEDLEGSSRDKFEVFAKIRAQGIAYDRDQLFNVLKKKLQVRAHPDMKLRENSIQPDSITYEVIEDDSLAGLIKMTATIKGIEEFIVDPSDEAGARLRQKIIAKVIGIKLTEAEKIITNFSEVDTVVIKVWPFWISTMPRIEENIKIKLLENTD